MNFLPDVYVPCEVCHGARYNRETLEVHYKGKTIAEVLDMPIEGAVEFFEAIPADRPPLRTLVDVGLGYVRLGQPAPTLSGGEAQRVKLAASWRSGRPGARSTSSTSRPPGLHFEDIRKLLAVLQRLVDPGNSVLVIEHNLDVIKTADWVIDLGPEGGNKGGLVVAEGTPEHVASVPASYTGAFLRPILDGRAVSVGKTQRKATAAATTTTAKAASKKSVAKKSPAKNSVAKKSTAKSSTAKKAANQAAVKKTTTKNATAKKATAASDGAARTASKRTAAKRSATKSSKVAARAGR